MILGWDNKTATHLVMGGIEATCLDENDPNHDRCDDFY
jgi:hypothetical protein